MRFRPVLIIIALMLLLPSAALADGGDIVGTVYLDNQTGSGLCVDVVDNGGNVVASQLTNGAGDYNVYVSQPGSYTVRFSDCGAGYVTTQWYPYAATQEDATAVVVESDGITPNVNGYLSSAGRITGNLKDTLNAVLTGACVKAEDQNGYPVGQTTTDGNGNYELGGLPAGQVLIKFEGCSAGNYVTEYYDNVRAPLYATAIDVQAGETKSGIDAILTPAGRITGHVQDANGAPVQNACVIAQADGSDVGRVYTDNNGNYEIRGVPPTGTYDLSASGCYDTSYMVQYASGPLVAPPGTTVVDFTLPHPAYITGHVYGDGKLLPSICITARNTVTGDEKQEQTAFNGYYEVNWIQPGTYDLTFSDCHKTGDWVSATTKAVVLADGQTLMGVDKTLRHADPPAASTDQPATDQPAPQADPPASGPGAATTTTAPPPPPPPVHACVVPKLVGLSLAKAKRLLAQAGCTLGKVARKPSRHSKRRTVLRQRTKRGVSKPAGFKVALTVAR